MLGMKAWWAPILAAALCVGSAASAKHDDKPVDPNKKVCRTDFNTTGTILRKSTCHTRAEWDEIDARDHNDAANMLQRSREGGNPATRQ
jgi:hypothetical protein